MRTKLFKMLIFSILAGVLYWYFNYQVVKTPSPPNVEEAVKETAEIKEIEKVEEKGTMSIPLEKPPFLK